MNIYKRSIGQGFGFLLLGLFAFAALGLEALIAFIIEPLVLGKNLNDFSTLENILHWIAVSIIWIICIYVLITTAKRKYSFDIFSFKEKLSLVNWIISLSVLLVSVIISVIDWNGFKVVKELQYNGWVKFAFQYFYYLIETVLVVLIIAFGQKAAELWFAKDKIPWGGILAGLTWGLVHMLTKGNFLSGLLSCLAAILFGIIYIVAKKNIYIAFSIIFLAFVL